MIREARRYIPFLMPLFAGVAWQGQQGEVWRRGVGGSIGSLIKRRLAPNWYSFQVEELYWLLWKGSELSMEAEIARWLVERLLESDLLTPQEREFLQSGTRLWGAPANFKESLVRRS